MNEGKVNQFTEEHLRLMIAIAHQAALAVEDTSYYTAMLQAERLAAVGQTIASLSHHIKNILQGVRGGSYLIELGLGDHGKAQGDDEKSKKAVSTIRKGWDIVERNQERISTLVMDMLTFSKERVPQPAPSDLNSLASEVAEEMQIHANDSGVTIEIETDPEMPIILFDPESMHQAILNIVTNAIDATAESEPAKVLLKTVYNEEEKVAHLIVQDNGPGIAPEDVEVIFNVFESRKGGRGTGLGLPVSRKILEEHGGQILVESELGKGSSFILELPANLQQEAKAPQPNHGQTFTSPDMPSSAPSDASSHH